MLIAMIGCTQRQRGQDVTPELSLRKFFTDGDGFFSKNTVLLEAVRRQLNGETIAYSYRIRKNDIGYRNISLIHPNCQIEVSDFYKKYKGLILFYCNRSLYSLRRPKRAVSRLKQKHDALLNKLFREDNGANTADLQQAVIEDHDKISLSDIPSSYFVLGKYDLLYKFYDSEEFIDLEKKFLYFQSFDVKRCFDSIYTHSIAWAIRGKDYSKAHKKSLQDGFEGEFDKLMQNSNYGETNGIPVGAEVSRIFAEVILQSIDLNIERSIKEQMGNDFRQGRDFEIRRYIDDFFVFANTKENCGRIQNICEKELEIYKLFVNENKNSRISRPFITPESSAKQKIVETLDGYFTQFGFKEGDKFPSPKSGLKLFQKMRTLIADYNISFYSIVSITLTGLKTQLLDALIYAQSESDKESGNLNPSYLKGYLKTIIKLSFNIFNLSIRFLSASIMFKISYIVLEIIKVIADPEIAGEVKQLLFTQYSLFCERLEHDDSETILECLDVILFLSELGDEFKLSAERLKSLFRLKEEGRNISYFEITVLLAYIKSDSRYGEIKALILAECGTKFFDSSFLRKTEIFLLFFDIMKCPHLTKEEKKNPLAKAKFNPDKKVKFNSDEMTMIIDFIEERDWFFDWNKQENLDLRSVLEIKERRLGY